MFWLIVFPSPDSIRLGKPGDVGKIAAPYGNIGRSWYTPDENYRGGLYAVVESPAFDFYAGGVKNPVVELVWRADWLCFDVARVCRSAGDILCDQPVGRRHRRVDARSRQNVVERRPAWRQRRADGVLVRLQSDLGTGRQRAPGARLVVEPARRLGAGGARL